MTKLIKPLFLSGSIPRVLQFCAIIYSILIIFIIIINLTIISDTACNSRRMYCNFYNVIDERENCDTKMPDARIIRQTSSSADNDVINVRRDFHSWARDSQKQISIIASPIIHFAHGTIDLSTLLTMLKMQCLNLLMGESGWLWKPSATWYHVTVGITLKWRVILDRNQLPRLS